jgi:hypothetical protein
VVQEKEATQEKDAAEVVKDPDLSWATEIRTPTPIMNPDKKGKERAKAKKANRHPDLVPLAIASHKIHAATVAVIITPPESVTKDRMMRKMARPNHHTNKQISTLPLMKQPLCSS